MEGWPSTLETLIVVDVPFGVACTVVLPLTSAVTLVLLAKSTFAKAGLLTSVAGKPFSVPLGSSTMLTAALAAPSIRKFVTGVVSMMRVALVYVMVEPSTGRSLVFGVVFGKSGGG